ncbi:MAG: winged helix-turn-helix domain-containing protein [Thermoplasmata archaeon]|nr:transcriptional regulator [Thermoplasmatales archaeon]PMP74586.1 MAG: transcriptional regulator [Aciduliprofundum sp.]
MRKNRSESRIIFEILAIIEKEECTSSTIIRRANIPYSKFKEIEENLLERELIIKVSNGDKVFYSITDHGRDLLRGWRKFKELMEMYGFEP